MYYVVNVPNHCDNSQLVLKQNNNTIDIYHNAYLRILNNTHNNSIHNDRCSPLWSNRYFIAQ